MSINWIFVGINQIFHMLFPALFRPLLLSPVHWPLTHPWARALTLHPTPGSAPLTRASSSARLGGLETPDNKQLQPSHWPPHAYAGIYPPQTNTLLSFQTGFIFPSLHRPNPQSHKIRFFFYSFFFFYLKWEEMKEVTGPIFPPLFYSLSPLVFLLSHCCPVLDFMCVCVCLCVSPMVERQPKCERDGCQSPFLSPKAPCLSSLLCRARLHLHIVI